MGLVRITIIGLPFLGVLGAAEPAVMLAVPPIDRAPVLDGRLADGEWDGAAATTGFAARDLDWAVAPPDLQTVVWLGRDATHLYLAMRAPLPAGAAPVARSRGGHDGIIQDDHLEWQLLPGAEAALAQREGGGFWKILANARGALGGNRIAGGAKLAFLPWESGAVAAGGVGDRAWAVELAVPLRAFGEAAASQTWIMQVMRDSGPGAAYSAWTGATWLDWERFPLIEFAEGVPAVQILGVEPTAGGLAVDVAVLAGVATAVDVTLVLDGGDRRSASRRLEAAAGRRVTAHLDFADLPLIEDERPVILTAAVAGRPVGRWRWRVPAPELPEIADLREQWRRHHADASLLGMLAVIGRRARPAYAQAAAAFARKDPTAAEAVARQLVADLPWAPHGHRLLAAVLARQGRTGPALDALEAAVARGEDDAVGLVGDEDLGAVQDDPRFTAILDLARSSPGCLPVRAAVAAAPRRRILLVDDANLAWDASARQLVAQWTAGRADRTRPLTALPGEMGAQLNAWWAEGSAAGHAGDAYDNRDHDHARLDPALFPQLAQIRYRLDARDAGINNEPAEGLRHEGAVVIGNCSEAETTGPYRRSLIQRLLVDAPRLAAARWQYEHNQVYVFPACFDHQPGLNGKPGGDGDLMPALTPYCLASQGYSYTDMPFVQAMAGALAALRPETKRRLVEDRQIAPVLNLLLRRSLVGVEGDDDYLSPAAHRSVFTGAELRPQRMAELAHAIVPDALPPRIALRVVEEDAPVRPGVEAMCLPGQGEELFTTPAAIARIMRSVQRRSWRLAVSADGSRDPAGRPLRFAWRVLRGEAAVVPSADGSGAVITVPWQGEHPVFPGSPMATRRIDILCVAHNGTSWSAPAYISYLPLGDEERIWREDGRLASVEYRDDRRYGYCDPRLSLPHRWRDDYRYATDGALLGWTRTRPGAAAETFDAAGRLLAADGTATEVRYRPVRVEGRATALAAVPLPSSPP